MGLLSDHDYAADRAARNRAKHGLVGGPYIGEVVSHLDSQRMGRLEVVIVGGTGPGADTASATAIPVDYAPPFFGSTPYRAMDANRNSSSTQASYGMWFIPPDIGSRVMVFFMSGTSQGFWVACIPEDTVNHMVPGLAASQYADLTPQEKQKLGTDLVPVAEINRRIKGQRQDDPDKITRPMHPFAFRLAEQGLLKDPIRGTTTASARRNTPSSVFGISTPGPPVVNGKKWKAGPPDNQFDVYAEREGGTQFVMDDGVIHKDEKTGKVGIRDELVRIRTRTGHQILLHNSSDLIYICNSRGTAWLEFTSNGKIDIFAADSVSIHSEVDFNFRADRNVNIEAGDNVNIVASRGSLHLEAGGAIEGTAGLDVNWSAKSHFNVSVGRRIRLTTNKDPLALENSGIDLYSTSGNINMFSFLPFKMQSTADINMKSGLGLNILSGAATVIKTAGNFDITTGGSNFINSTAGSNIFNATAGSHIERATLVDMNGPTVPPTNPTLVSSLKTATEALTLVPETATVVTGLEKYVLPYREADKNATTGQQKGWEGNNYFRQPDIKSIMKRVPTHEPWDHHESLDPTRFTPEKTSRDRISS